MKLSEKIRTLRQTYEMTQEELARAVGLSTRMIQKYETKGRYPRNREIYQKMAECFGVEVNYLLTEDEEFVADAANQYGRRAAKQAELLVDEITGLFSGGEISEEDKDVLMRAIQDAYWHSKGTNIKYTQKKYRGNNS